MGSSGGSDESLSVHVYSCVLLSCTVCRRHVATNRMLQARVITDELTSLHEYVHSFVHPHRMNQNQTHNSTCTEAVVVVVKSHSPFHTGKPVSSAVYFDVYPILTSS